MQYNTMMTDPSSEVQVKVQVPSQAQAQQAVIVTPTCAGSEASLSSTSSSPPPSSSGRIKEKPVCNVPALRKEHMSAEELSQFCFKPEEVWMDDNDDNDYKEKEGDLDANAHTNVGMNANVRACTSATSPSEWASFKRSILCQTESRNGRDLQRFATANVDVDGTVDGMTTTADSGNGNGTLNVKADADADADATKTQVRTRQQLFRLTTGSVPIMRDGRILLVSSSRKEEWILPKGGWEADESLEVSALRETYEEGGVLGILGPRLTKIEYEPRKVKKRRLELESLQKKVEIAYGHGHGSVGMLPRGLTSANITMNTNVHTSASGAASIISVSVPSTDSSICPSEEGDLIHMPSSSHVGTGTSTSTTTTATNNNKDCATVGIGTSGSIVRDDAVSLSSVASVTSDASTNGNGGHGHGQMHSGHGHHIRMTMFPLYVMEVRETWPESGRARKVVDIDTAIDIMTSRPEFQRVLIEVKEKGYHLLARTTAQNAAR